MLLSAIRNRLYLPPYNSVGWAENVVGRQTRHRHAPKIETAHRLLCFETMESSRIVRMSRAFSSTWAFATVPVQKFDYQTHRVIFEGPLVVLSSSSDYTKNNASIPEIPPGLPYWPPNATNDASKLANCPMLVNTIDGKTISASSIKVEGSATMPAYKAALKHRLIGQPRHEDSKGAITFHAALTARP